MPAGATEPVVRVVRFGVRMPSRRKAAMLDDALRRQTLAYGRALEAVQPEAAQWARLDARLRCAGVRRALQTDLRMAIAETRKAIGAAAYRAAKSAHVSSMMADAIVRDVLATLASWLGWRARFRAARPDRIRRAENARAVALADMPAVVSRLQARRRRARITEAHVRTSLDARVARERNRRPPSYPVGPRLTPPRSDSADLLDALAASMNKAEEDRLRDALATQPRLRTHPLAWTRPQDDAAGRGVSLFWDDNRLFGFLPGLLPSGARRQRKPVNGRPVRLVGVPEPVVLKRTGGIILPLSFGRTAWAYLDGWTPRTARLVNVDGRYELHVAFARQGAPAQVDPARLSMAVEFRSNAAR
jgi:hypothetical protein